MPPSANPTEPISFDLVKAAILVHGDELASYPEVIRVQPGFTFEQGLITSEPAVEVLVARKKAIPQLNSRDILPKRLGKVRVDVRQATISELLETLGKPKPEAAPEAALEGMNRLAFGKGLVDLRTPVERESTVAGLEAERTEYEPPNFQMREIDQPVDITCHSSPDSGWKILKQYLAPPIRHLTATIFEFEAKHVRDALIGACDPDGTMDFVMQFKNTRAWDNADAAADLGQALAGRLDFAWAAVASTRAVSEGWFPTAYHIKVIVKDHRHLWLSSGNWKESNQPQADPFHPAGGFSLAKFLRDHNREWHIVCDCAALAEQFERFVQFDLAQAKRVQVANPRPEAEMPDVFVPVTPEAELEVEPEFFEPIRLRKQLRITPLISPDNFIEEVTAAVKKATRRLYIQNQYVKPTPLPRWRELNEFVSSFSRRNDVDFRVIIRDLDFENSLRLMKEMRFDTSKVRILSNTHTKGILVDDELIVVGSHNWSGQGFMENRDASLIFYDKDIIDYYEKIFLFDWSRSRKPRSSAPESAPFLALPDEPTPVGMRRVSLGEFD